MTEQSKPDPPMSAADFLADNKARYPDLDLSRMSSSDIMTERNQINWNHWRKVEAVEPWEACALSVDIDPDTMFPERDGYLVGPGVLPMHGEQPNETTIATLVEWKRREKLLDHYVNDTNFFTPVESIDGKLRVRLPQFAAWLIAMGISNFAAPLEQIAEGPLGVATAPAAAERPLDTRERTTYLRIIRVLIDNYPDRDKLLPAGKETGIIEAWLSAARYSSPKEAAIRRAVRAALEAQP